MALLARRRFRRSGLWLYVLPPTASITERTSHRSLRESSPSHQSLAIGKGQEAPGGVGPNRTDSRLAKRVSSSVPTIWLAQLHVCLPRQRRSGPWASGPDCQEDGLAPGIPVDDRRARRTIGKGTRWRQ